MCICCTNRICGGIWKQRFANCELQQSCVTRNGVPATTNATTPQQNEMVICGDFYLTTLRDHEWETGDPGDKAKYIGRMTLGIQWKLYRHSYRSNSGEAHFGFCNISRSAKQKHFQLSLASLHIGTLLKWWCPDPSEPQPLERPCCSAKTWHNRPALNLWCGCAAWLFNNIYR